MKIKLPKINRLFRRKEVRRLCIEIGRLCIETKRLETECDQLAYAYNNLMSWGDFLNLTGSELSMLKNALENRIFKEVVYGIHTRLGMRQTYEDFIGKIKKEIKRRNQI